MFDSYLLALAWDVWTYRSYMMTCLSSQTASSTSVIFTSFAVMWALICLFCCMTYDQLLVRHAHSNMIPSEGPYSWPVLRTDFIWTALRYWLYCGRKL
jgi:hypothetical protein